MPVVRIGPSRTCLQQYNVNDDQMPFLVNSTNFTGYITVRLQNYQCKNDPNVIRTNPYFQNHRRFFSFQFQGRFKPTNPRRQDLLWTFDDVLFCAETEEAIRPPMGASFAVKFATFIDPGFTADGMFLDRRPWAGSWLMCGMNIVRVWKAENDERLSTDHSSDLSDEGYGGSLDLYYQKGTYGRRRILEKGSYRASLSALPSGDNDPTLPLLSVGPWAYYGQHHLEEDTRLILPKEHHVLTAAKRRNHFSDPAVRQSHVFDPANVYAFDFFNDFTNFSTMTADMIIRFSITNVLRDQPLRFVCRDQEGDAVFFVIEIDYKDLLEK